MRREEIILGGVRDCLSKHENGWTQGWHIDKSRACVHKGRRKKINATRAGRGPGDTSPPKFTLDSHSFPGSEQCKKLWKLSIFVVQDIIHDSNPVYSRMCIQ